MLVDTSAILALLNRRDRHHHDVAAAVARTTESLVVPITVLPEVDYLLTQRLGTHVAVFALESITTGGFRLESVTHVDLPRILELMRQYSDNAIGFVDASIVALAERLHATKILMLDRRHFGQIRPRHASALEIVP